jgi:hypothetical protein
MALTLRAAYSAVQNSYPAVLCAAVLVYQRFPAQPSELSTGPSGRESIDFFYEIWSNDST